MMRKNFFEDFCGFIWNIENKPLSLYPKSINNN